MENFLHERDNSSGRDSDDGPPENHFQLAPVVRVGGAEQIAQQRNEPQKNRAVNHDDSDILGDAIRQYRSDNRQGDGIAVSITTKAQAETGEHQHPLQPGNLAVNRRARRKHREEEIKEFSQDAVPQRTVGEQEVLKMRGRGGKLAGQVRGRDKGCEYQRQQPRIAVFHSKKQNCETHDREEKRIGRQDLHRHRTGRCPGVA